MVDVVFLGPRVFSDNAVVLSIQPPGAIHLSDGTIAGVLKIWDEAGLPRHVRHIVEAQGEPLRVHNKYRVRHDNGEVTEDNFTGNAGIIVTEMRSNCRRYECSNGPGKFSKGDLIFELTWQPFVS